MALYLQKYICVQSIHENADEDERLLHDNTALFPYTNSI